MRLDRDGKPEGDVGQTGRGDVHHQVADGRGRAAFDPFWAQGPSKGLVLPPTQLLFMVYDFFCVTKVVFSFFLSFVSFIHEKRERTNSKGSSQEVTVFCCLTTNKMGCSETTSELSTLTANVWFGCRSFTTKNIPRVKLLGAVRGNVTENIIRADHIERLTSAYG